ncbi:MAG: tripartite tricarboxylate transporter permease [Lachnospiraceae bacterium]
MDILSLIGQSFLTVLTPSTLLMLIMGVAVGIVFGAIPGLSASMAIALFLPMTFSMEVTNGICTLVALYVGGVSGGLVSAILLKMPGTSGSVATTFDGYPLAQKGQAGRAVGIAVISSFTGGMASFIVLMFVAPQVAKIALKFSAVEYFAVILFAIMMVFSLAGKSVLKGVIAAILGLMVSTVGIAPVDGVQRFTFGKSELLNGFSILPTLIGLFAVTELFNLAEKKRTADKESIIELKKIKGFGFSFKEFWQHKYTFLRSFLIGLGIGILPGIGDTASNMVSYSVAKTTSKHPEEFGHGAVDGIIAPECANNASIGGALIPLLSLGIPGDGVTAIILGGFMIQGLTPGPLLFTTNRELVYSIFAALIVCNFIMLALEFFGMRGFVKMLRVPKHILLPIIILMCMVGAFAANNRLFDVKSILLFGVLGYAMKKFDVPVAPFVLSFVLGTLLETNLRRGIMLTQGSFTAFFTRPIAAVFLVAAMAALIFSLVKTFRNYRRENGR